MAEPEEAPTQAQFVTFNYQKSSIYRTIHADGAVASATPRGLAAVTFFNERGVIPRTTRRAIIAETSGGAVTLGDEEQLEGLSDVMRQVETTVIMDLQTIIELRDLLDRVAEGLRQFPKSNSAATAENDGSKA